MIRGLAYTKSNLSVYFITSKSNSIIVWKERHQSSVQSTLKEPYSYPPVFTTYYRLLIIILLPFIIRVDNRLNQLPILIKPPQSFW